MLAAQLLMQGGQVIVDRSINGVVMLLILSPRQFRTTRDPPALLQ